MRVPKISSQVEFKVHRVLNNRVTNLNVIGSSSFDDLLLEQRFNCRVEFFHTVFNKDRGSVTDAAFQMLKVVTIGEFKDLNLVILSEVTNPFVSLTLRIDEQRPSSCSLSDDSVINREIIRRQSPQVPLANLNGVTKSFGEGEFTRVRDLSIGR